MKMNCLYQHLYIQLFTKLTNSNFMTEFIQKRNMPWRNRDLLFQLTNYLSGNISDFQAGMIRVSVNSWKRMGIWKWYNGLDQFKICWVKLSQRSRISGPWFFTARHYRPVIHLNGFRLVITEILSSNGVVITNPTRSII